MALATIGGMELGAAEVGGGLAGLGSAVHEAYEKYQEWKPGIAKFLDDANQAAHSVKDTVKTVGEAVDNAVEAYERNFKRRRIGGGSAVPAREKKSQAIVLRAAKKEAYREAEKAIVRSHRRAQVMDYVLPHQFTNSRQLMLGSQKRPTKRGLHYPVPKRPATPVNMGNLGIASRARLPPNPFDLPVSNWYLTRNGRIRRRSKKKKSKKKVRYTPRKKSRVFKYNKYHAFN